MILLIALMLALARAEHCAKGEGAYIVEINVHVDGAAIAALEAVYAWPVATFQDSETGTSRFFKGIFDDVNETLMPNGVQVLGVFKNMMMEDFNAVYDKTSCIYDGVPEIVRGQMVMGKIKSKGEEVENRILVFFCPERVILPSIAVPLPQGECESVRSIVYNALPLFSMAIRDAVFDIVARTKFTGTVTKSYNDALCSAVEKCTGDRDAPPPPPPKEGEKEEPTTYKFERGLKGVRHLSSGKDVLKDGDRMDEYDTYDDSYVKHHRGTHYEVTADAYESDDKRKTIDKRRSAPGND